MELYQQAILRTPNVDFLPICKKLMELAAAEKANPGIGAGPSELVPGEGNAGKIRRNDPESIQEMQMCLRFLHHPLTTETAYLGWLRRFQKHVGNKKLDDCGVGHKDVKTTMIYTQVMNRPGLATTRV